MNRSSLKNCIFCDSAKFKVVYIYSEPPKGEISIPLAEKVEYSREITSCVQCGHYYSLHEMELSDLYEGQYVDSTYGDADGIKNTFERIINIPLSQSDNKARVIKVDEVAKRLLDSSVERGEQLSVLDVGSGLCVFLHEMKKLGWDCTSLDPDKRAAQHAKDVVGVKAVCSDFRRAKNLGKFHLISFNKVLEHVEDPILMLSQSREYLEKGGVVYVELPDGEAAARDSFLREEFFIDHNHVFTFSSISMLAKRSGYRAQLLERLREPSSKYTLRIFLTCDS